MRGAGGREAEMEGGGARMEKDHRIVFTIFLLEKRGGEEGGRGGEGRGGEGRGGEGRGGEGRGGEGRGGEGRGGEGRGGEGKLDAIKCSYTSYVAT